MRRNLGRQTSESGGNEVSSCHDREQRSCDFAPRMARTRQEMLDQKCYNKQQRQDYAADPPRNRRPAELRGVFLLELEKQQARGGQDGSGKKETGSQNE